MGAPSGPGSRRTPRDVHRRARGGGRPSHPLREDVPRRLRGRAHVRGVVARVPHRGIRTSRSSSAIVRGISPAMRSRSSRRRHGGASLSATARAAVSSTFAARSYRNRRGGGAVVPARTPRYRRDPVPAPERGTRHVLALVAGVERGDPLHQLFTGGELRALPRGPRAEARFPRPCREVRVGLLDADAGHVAGDGDLPVQLPPLDREAARGFSASPVPCGFRGSCRTRNPDPRSRGAGHGGSRGARRPPRSRGPSRSEGGCQTLPHPRTNAGTARPAPTGGPPAPVPDSDRRPQVSSTGTLLERESLKAGWSHEADGSPELADWLESAGADRARTLACALLRGGSVGARVRLLRSRR